MRDPGGGSRAGNWGWVAQGRARYQLAGPETPGRPRFARIYNQKKMQPPLPRGSSVGNSRSRSTRLCALSGCRAGPRVPRTRKSCALAIRRSVSSSCAACPPRSAVVGDSRTWENDRWKCGDLTRMGSRSRTPLGSHCYHDRTLLCVFGSVPPGPIRGGG